MADKYFVDPNILICAHDRAAGAKHDKARRPVEHLWTTGQGVLSTQVFEELGINLRRKLARPLSQHETRALIEDYLSWEVVVNTPESILEALEIAARYQISFWDALILQAAETSESAVLYSEDLATGPRYRAVRVVNPFAE